MLFIFKNILHKKTFLCKFFSMIHKTRETYVLYLHPPPPPHPRREKEYLDHCYLHYIEGTSKLALESMNLGKAP